MDRESANRNLRAAMFAGGLAIFVFGTAFYISVLYLA